MATYGKLESFFKAGTFYGLGETVHVHVHPTEPAAVINCFNLEDRPIEQEVEFVPQRFGLDARRPYSITGVTSRASGQGHVLLFRVPARGHQLAEIRGS